LFIRLKRINFSSPWCLEWALLRNGHVYNVRIKSVKIYAIGTCAIGIVLYRIKVMDLSKQEEMLNALTHRTERIEGKVDELKLELRVAAVFLVALIIALKIWSVGASVLAAGAVSAIAGLVNWSRLRKYGTF